MSSHKWKNDVAIKANLNLFEFVSGLNVDFHKSLLVEITIESDPDSNL